MKRRLAPFEAARSDGAIYVRIHGLASMTVAPTFEAFADGAIADGVRQFVLDLEPCTGVDSTFMGLLLSLSNRLRDGDDSSSGIVLVNVNEHAQRQLSSVGVDAFVTIRPGTTRLPAALRLTEVEVVDAPDRERLKLMVRAHKALVAADARNRAKFGAFLEGIVAELGE